MLFTFRNWLRQALATSRRRAGSGASRLAQGSKPKAGRGWHRPRLEGLEDRTLLSGFCATPGKDGTPASPLTGVVNTYYAGTANVAAGATSLTLGATSGAAASITSGDLLLIMQVQNGTISYGNNPAYGDGTGSGSGTTSSTAGTFEYVEATNSASAGGTVTFVGAGAGGGLVHSYFESASTSSHGQATFEVVRVPQYLNATLGASLTATAWNGATGGILAIDVAGTLNLGGGTINVDGKGFRGGAGLQLTGNSSASPGDYDFNSPNNYTPKMAGAHGSKGEGIAGTPRYVYNAATNTDVDTAPVGTDGYPGGSMARGAPGNAGGGGTEADTPSNDQNTGGGGGGNGGAGGQGGYSWATAENIGGIGGAAYTPTVGQLILGGGGGAGVRNNSDTIPTASAGGTGGGIVMVRTGTVSGTGTISADGTSGVTPQNDGGPGGGAGGSVEVLAGAGSLTGLSIQAQGALGLDAFPTANAGTAPPPSSSSNFHGPGGGGGGGVIVLSSAAGSTNVAGGTDGTTTTSLNIYGAVSGNPGVVLVGADASQIPGPHAGYYCTADLAVTNSVASTVSPGGIATYTITLTNNGPDSADNVALTDSFPTGVTVLSQTQVSGTALTLSNTSSQISDTVASLPSGQSAVIQVQAKVGAGVAVGTVLSDTASASTTTVEPNLTNNSATASTTVTDADVAVTLSAPSLVNNGSTVTYSITVTNNGPNAAQNVSLTDAFPSGTTYSSQSQTGGPTFTLSHSSSQISDTLTSLASGQSATFQLVLNVTAAAGSTLNDTANVSTTSFDPDLTNNAATATTVVGPLSADLKVTTSAPATVPAGQNLVYTITLTNLGTTLAQAVSLSDTLPAGTTLVSQTQTSGPAFTLGSSGSTITDTVASFANGATATFQVVVAVPASTANNTSLSETASVSSSTTDPVPGNNTASAPSTAKASADLAVEKFSPGLVATDATITTGTATGGNATSLTNSGASWTAGQFVGYKIEITSGTGAGQVGTITANTATSVTVSGWTTGAASGSVYAILPAKMGGISTGSNTTTTFNDTNQAWTANQWAGDAIRIVRGTGSGQVLPITSNTATQLTLNGSWTTTPDNTSVYQILTPTFYYTVWVYNNGPSNAQGVSLTDTVPGPMVFVSQKQVLGPAFTLSNSGNAVTDTIATLPVGTLALPAYLTGTSTGSNTTSTFNDTTQSWTANQWQGRFLEITGGTGSGQIQQIASNTATQITLFNTWTTTPDATSTYEILPMSQYPVAEFQIGVFVPSGTALNTLLPNTASATSTTTDPISSNNSGATQTTVSQGADVAVTNTVSPSPVVPGGTVTYTITVTNNGPSVASNVTLSDLLPANTTFVNQTSTSGFTLSHSGNQITDTVATLNPFTSATFQVTATVNSGGAPFSATATVGSTTVDLNLTNNSATATDTVSPWASNDSYSVTDGSSLTVLAASGVLTNDTGTGLTAKGVVSNVSHGTLTLNADGSFTYTPSAGFSGTDSFTYNDKDSGSNTSNTATVTITVNPGAVNDSYSGSINTPLTVTAANGLLNNDQGSGLTVQNIVAAPANGTLLIHSDGSFTYTPNAGFTGTDTFTYDVIDGNETVSSPATVSIFVNAPPALAANAPSVTVNEGQTASNTGTWSDPNGDTVTLSASVGTVTENANGTWSWSFATTDGPAQAQTVTITGTDSHGASSSTTFNLGVNNVAPTATFTNGGAVNEGSTGTVSFSSPSDPSSVDTTAGFHFAYDFNNDGTFDSGDGTYAGSLTSASVTVPASYLADGPATRVVRGRIIDKDGGFTDYTTTITVNNVPPTAVADSGSTDQNTTLSTPAPGVLGNDSDVPSDPLSVTQVTNGTTTVAAGASIAGSNGGTFVINADGSYTFNPGAAFQNLAAGQTRNTQVTYTVSDGDGGTATATLTVTVTGLNDAPTSAGHTVTTNEDTAYTFSASDFPFTDVDSGNTLQAVRIDGLPGTGALTFNGSAVTVGQVIPVAQLGSLVFTPAANQSGSPYTTFPFSVSDGTAFSPSATMTVNVTPVNDPPVNSVPGAQTAQQNATFTFSTANGNALSATDVDAGSGIEKMTLNVGHGSLSLVSASGLSSVSGTGTSASPLVLTGTLAALNAALGTGLVYTPTAGYHGPDSLSLTTNDQGNTGIGGPLSDTDTVSILVNAPPSASPDALSTTPGTALPIPAGTLLGNDTDPDGDPLTVTGVSPSSSQGGSVSLTGTTVTYTPPAGFHGTDTFTYTVSDGHGGSSSATVTVTVDNPPTTNNNTVGTPPNTPYTFKGTDFPFSDPDAGDTLQKVRIDTLPPTGTLTLNGSAVAAGQQIPAAQLGLLVYTPPANQAGNPLTSFTFSVSDGLAFSPSATMNVHVLIPPAVDLNGPGAGTGYTATFTEDGGSVAVVDSSNLTVSDPDSTQIQSGTVTLGSIPDGAAEALLVNTAGTSISWSYNPATGVLSLSGTDTLAHYQQVLRSLAYNNTSQDPHTADRSVSVVLTDDSGTSSAPAVATVHVVAVDDAPINAVPGAQTVQQGNTLTFSTANGNALSSSDVDAEAGILKMTLTVGHGSLSLTSASGLSSVSGSGTGTLVLTGTLSALNAALGTGLVYTPTAGYHGPDSLSLTTNDQGNTGIGGPLSDTDTVSILVNAPPSASPDALSTTPGTALPIPAGTLLSNDTDPDGDPLTVTGVSPSSSQGGSVSLTGTTVTYTPPAGFHGTDTFTYTVSDGHGGSSSATVTVTVDNAPTTNNNAVGTPQNVPYTFKGTDFPFSDPDAGDTLQKVRIDTLPSVGSLTLNGTPVVAGQQIPVGQIGQLKYTPPANQSGGPLTSFTFSVSDGLAFSPSATMSVNVTPPPAVDLNGGGPGTGYVATFTEDGGAVAIVDASNLTVTDLNSGNFQSATATLGSIPDGAAEGLLVSTAGTSISWSYNPATGVLSLSGTDTLAHYQQVLQTLAYNNTSQDPHTADRSVSVALTDDLGLASAPAVATVHVVPVDDAPVIAAPAAQTVQQSSPLTFSSANGNALSFSDVDAENGLEKVTLSVAHGTLSLGSTSGLSSVNNNGTGAVTLTGTIAALDAALAGLVYTPTAGYHGGDSLAVGIDDQGNTGIGGPLSASASIPLLVNAPPAANPDSFTMLQNTALPIPVGSLLGNDTDPDGDTLSLLGISTRSTQGGTVSLSGGVVTYTPASGFHGTDTFTYRVSDGHGGTATGTVTVRVDAPPASSNGNVGMPLNTPYTFKGTDFPFSDPDAGDTLQQVRIDTLPGTGTLTLNGAPVSPGQVIPVGQIGLLKYTPPANQTGGPLTSFGFSVSDGTAWSSSASMRVSVWGPPAISAIADITSTTCTGCWGLSMTSSFTDPSGIGPFTGTVDYGDGSGVQALTVNANLTFSLSHMYTQRGVYQVTVTVTDGLGMSSMTSFLFGAHRSLPVPSTQLFTINDGSAQRSMVTSVTISFADHESLDPGAICVTTSAGKPVGIRLITRDYNGQTVVLVQFTDPGLIGGSLADGRYTITIDGSKVHNSQGAAYNGGGLATQTFFRLFGDSNGDGKVDSTDLSSFQSALRSMDGTSPYRWYFDYDQNCTVDSSDYSQFLARYGKSV